MIHSDAIKTYYVDENEINCRNNKDYLSAITKYIVYLTASFSMSHYIKSYAIPLFVLFLLLLILC